MDLFWQESIQDQNVKIQRKKILTRDQTFSFLVFYIFLICFNSKRFLFMKSLGKLYSGKKLKRLCVFQVLRWCQAKRIPKMK